MFIILDEPERRKGFPMTSTEQRLCLIIDMIDGYPHQPKSADEAIDNFWFFERGKGWFLGDGSWIKERALDENECGISVDGDTLGFHPEMAGSSPAFRSKKK